MKVMARTIWVRRRMKVSRQPSAISFSVHISAAWLWTGPPLVLWLLEFLCLLFLFGPVGAVGRCAAIFLEFVMQGLQANAEDFGGARFVVVRGFESFHNQQTFGFTHGGANANANRIRIVGGRAEGDLPEARRQVLGLDHRSFANDHGALQRVAQLANIARPGMVAKGVQHSLADGGHKIGR